MQQYNFGVACAVFSLTLYREKKITSSHEQFESKVQTKEFFFSNSVTNRAHTSGRSQNLKNSDRESTISIVVCYQKPNHLSSHLVSLQLPISSFIFYVRIKQKNYFYASIPETLTKCNYPQLENQKYHKIKTKLKTLKC